jgi:predicted kinase
MTEPLLVVFVGIPGSGKTTFAKNLAQKLQAIVLNSDAIRMSMWGSLEAIQATHTSPEDRKHGNKLTFGAMNYAADQILQTGVSVIYDCNANHRYERQEKHDIADKNHATSVIVRIRVPYEVSLRRVQEREAAHDQRQMSAEKARGVLERFMDEIEEPDPDEFVIEINGEQSFDEQYAVFKQELDIREQTVSRRYLVTGVAGSGKSTLEKLFKERGYTTIDIDDGFAEWRHAETDEVLVYTPDGEGWHEVAEWVVDTDKLQRFFDAHPEDDVLVFGSFARMKTVVSMFDKVFLLEYPNEQAARQRIASRDGGYGKHPGELARILSYIQPYQDKMKVAGAQAIDCTLPLEEIVVRIKMTVCN